MRRLEKELRGVEPGMRAERAQPVAHRFPGLLRGLRRRRSRGRHRVDLDFGVRPDAEHLVRRGDPQLRHAVAEVVVALDALAGCRLDVDAMREAALPGQVRGVRRSSCCDSVTGTA